MSAPTPNTNSGKGNGGPSIALVVGWFILLFGACIATAWAAIQRPEETWSGPALTAVIAGGTVLLGLAPIALSMARKPALKRGEIDRFLLLTEETRENSALSRMPPNGCSTAIANWTCFECSPSRTSLQANSTPPCDW